MVWVVLMILYASAAGAACARGPEARAMKPPKATRPERLAISIFISLVYLKMAAADRGGGFPATISWFSATLPRRPLCLFPRVSNLAHFALITKAEVVHLHYVLILAYDAENVFDRFVFFPGHRVVHGASHRYYF